MTSDDQQTRIALRVKALREERGMSQEALASALGFNDRQTLAAIEAGVRRISPEELARAAEVLGAEVELFVDPYRLVGEGKFSFRARDVEPEVLSAFEQTAGRWIATYRELATRLGAGSGPLGKKLELVAESSFEEAADAAEALWREWKLGDVPAEGLEEAIERELGVLVLYVDAPEGISGAASHLPRYHTILVNRNEPRGRRSFDLAHELFHVLTWDAMPPRRVEPWEIARRKGNRTEYLAENFAASLLMPRPVVARRWEARGEEELTAWLARSAAELRVSPVSLQWRLVNLGLLARSQVPSSLPAPRTGRPRDAVPLLFSRRFVALVATAVDAGRLSLRRAAHLLGLTVADLGELCAAHGCPLAYDLNG